MKSESWQMVLIFMSANTNLYIINTGKAIRFPTVESICKELNCQPGDILEFRG
ncbi:helix-turn-helix domain-containing protein [Clostridium sp. YIM B02505]|uniref:Helix-turn-helix domain-containing protein n=1 Tax=Clostridium yunnanense TaxID=2800325 RepID=A0ABS1ES69_9CLOT|nr:helix-turn-helix domain-containing protein [Clostridium yunnanense]